MKNTNKKIKNKIRKMQYPSHSYISRIYIRTVKVKWLSHDRAKRVADLKLAWCNLFSIPASYILIY